MKKAISPALAIGHRNLARQDVPKGTERVMQCLLVNTLLQTLQSMIRETCKPGKFNDKTFVIQWSGDSDSKFNGHLDENIAHSIPSRTGITVRPHDSHRSPI